MLLICFATGLLEDRTRCLFDMIEISLSSELVSMHLIFNVIITGYEAAEGKGQGSLLGQGQISQRCRKSLGSREGSSWSLLSISDRPPMMDRAFGTVQS